MIRPLHALWRPTGAAVVVGGLLAGAAPLVAAADSSATASVEHVQPAHGVDRGRIEFAPGTDSGSVTGSVARGDWHEWVFRAFEGQSIEMSVVGPATFNLIDPNGGRLADDAFSFSGPLPASGDYLLQVGPFGSSAEYILGLRITGSTTPPPAPPTTQPRTGTTERIEFARGTNNGSVTGDVLPATRDRYLLRASAGQTMTVHVDPLVDNITFTIFAPDGTPLAEHQARATVTLPTDGDYVVELRTTSSGGPYQMTVWID